jgi:hypothetical protein
MAIGNYDHDGNLDVVIALTTKVLILHGLGGGALGGPQEIPTAADGVLSDIFGNALRASLVLWSAGTSSIVVRRQDPANPGSFLDEQPLGGPFGRIRRAKLGFLSGNSVPSLIVQDDAEMRVFTASLLNEGTFLRGPKVGNSGDLLAAADDLNDEGADDVALVTGNGTLMISPGNNGAFGAPVMIASGATADGVAFGKFDGDDALDLIVATPDGGVVYRQTAPGVIPTFTRVAGTVPGVTGPTLMVADVDGDKRDDLLVPAGILQQCANGTFSTLVPIATSKSTLVRDLDKNGKPDLLRIVGQTLEVYRQ